MFYPYTIYTNQNISKRLKNIYALVHKNKTTKLSNDDARFLFEMMESLSNQLENAENPFSDWYDY